MAIKRIGKILITERLLLQWLMFPRGKLLDVSLDKEVGVLELTITHKEMPIVREAEPIPIITPEYTITLSKRKSYIQKVKRLKYDSLSQGIG